MIILNYYLQSYNIFTLIIPIGKNILLPQTKRVTKHFKENSKTSQPVALFQAPSRAPVISPMSLALSIWIKASLLLRCTSPCLIVSLQLYSLLPLSFSIVFNFFASAPHSSHSSTSKRARRVSLHRHCLTRGPCQVG